MFLAVDYSENQPELPWTLWPQVDIAIGRVSIGYRQDAVWPRFMEQAMNAGKKYRAGYGVILHHDSEIPFFDPVRQCQTFISRLVPGLITLAVLDIEAAGVTEWMVRLWCDYYDANGPLPLALYGNKGLETILGIENQRYAKYPVWCADYGPGLITSVPPTSATIQYPRFPRIGKNRGQLWQFAGNNGRLAPYTRPIDLSRFDGTEEQLAAYFNVVMPVPSTELLEIKQAAQDIITRVDRLLARQ